MKRDFVLGAACTVFGPMPSNRMLSGLYGPSTELILPYSSSPLEKVLPEVKICRYR